MTTVNSIPLCLVGKQAFHQGTKVGPFLLALGWQSSFLPPHQDFICLFDRESQRAQVEGMAEGEGEARRLCLEQGA